MFWTASTTECWQASECDRQHTSKRLIAEDHIEMMTVKWWQPKYDIHDCASCHNMVKTEFWHKLNCIVAWSNNSSINNLVAVRCSGSLWSPFSLLSSQAGIWYVVINMHWLSSLGNDRQNYVCDSEVASSTGDHYGRGDYSIVFLGISGSSTKLICKILIFMWDWKPSEPQNHKLNCDLEAISISNNSSKFMQAA